MRRCLDGIHVWPAVARDLAEAWLDDLDTGTPVLPAPLPPDRSSIVVRVRNQALVMTHVIGLPPVPTCCRRCARVGV